MKAKISIAIILCILVSSCSAVVRSADDAAKLFLRSLDNGNPKVVIPDNVNSEKYIHEMRMYIFENASDIPGAIDQFEELLYDERGVSTQQSQVIQQKNLGKRWSEMKKQDSLFAQRFTNNRPRRSLQDVIDQREEKN